jgi:hypothetical protein
VEEFFKFSYATQIPSSRTAHIDTFQSHIPLTCDDVLYRVSYFLRERAQAEDSVDPPAMSADRVASLHVSLSRQHAVLHPEMSELDY